MKFTALSTKFEKLLKKQKKGKTIEPKKLQNLLQILNKKKSRYEKTLKENLSAEKRKSFKSKLKVVNAHIKKTEKLLSDKAA